MQKKIKDHSDEEWANRSTMHAIDVISAYLEATKKKEVVYIFANCLNGEVYGHPDVVNAARIALKKGVEFHIAIQKDEVDAGGLLFYNTVIRKEYPKNTYSANKGKAFSENFMVVGKGMYRIEYEKACRKAHCSVNRPKVVTSLISAFNSL